MSGRWRRGARWFLLSLSCALGLANSLRAHPIPRENHDRVIVVRPMPEGVWIQYFLLVDAGQASRDLRDVELPGVTTLEQLCQEYTRYMAPILAGNLMVRLDGRTIPLRIVRQNSEVLDHFRCEIHLRGDWKLQPGRPYAFAFREGNFDLDTFSHLEVSLTSGRGIRLGSVTAADRALQDRPALDRKRGDMERLRRLSATLTLAQDDPPAEYKPTAPPPPEAPRSRPRHTIVAENHPGTPDGAGIVKPFRQRAPASRATADRQGLVELLLDDRRSFAVLLLIMAGLGAAHALTPGHGKTLVAAYLVGERGTVWHALVLGVVTTLTHTGAVIALAALGYVFPDAVPATARATQLVGGLLIALLGLWLLMRRLSGQADHIHLGRGHHHHHHGHDQDHTHDHEHVHRPADGTSSVGWWHLVVLGMHGGIVPCWDAIVILTLGVTTGRLRMALPLLLAFSAGLAGVLVTLGIGVVWARRWAGTRWGSHAHWQRLTRLLPIASALVITVLGLWLCYDSTHTPSVSP